MKIQLQISTEKLLEKYFSEYKDYHQYALISILILMAIYQIWQALFVSRKIETFKTDLKKSEIKFSRFHNMQIDTLKILYNRIVTFHYKNHNLFTPTSTCHSSLKSKIKEWRAEFYLVIETFHRERILLPIELVAVVKKFENNFQEILVRLNEELKSLNDLEEANSSIDEQVIYGSVEVENDALTFRLKSMNENEHIKNSEKIFRELRESIEKYFAELVK